MIFDRPTRVEDLNESTDVVGIGVRRCEEINRGRHMSLQIGKRIVVAAAVNDYVLAVRRLRPGSIALSYVYEADV